jgi:Flp pilus assembly protein TadG
MLSSRRGSSMAEAAITMPVVLLVLLAGINFSLVSHTALVAANAANYGARVGAVSRQEPKFWAQAAARTALGANRTGGSFDDPYVQVDENPGGVVSVSIHWTYPSIFSGICSFFGGWCPKEYEGTAVSAWKKEGW